MPYQDLRGKKFGKLTVIEQCGIYKSPTGRSSDTLWVCKCDCGNTTIAGTSRLNAGYKKSCGCSRKDNICYKNYKHGAENNGWSGHGGISGTIWNRIVKTAEKRNIPVEVTIEDIWELFQKQNGRCSLSGEVLYFAKTYKELLAGKNTASLDRIDSKKGYTKDNIQWTHVIVNFMKQGYSQNYFIKWCSKVSKFNTK